MAEITHNQMAKMFRRLATSYTAGIDIKTVFTRETEMGSTRYRQESRKVLQGIRSGQTLAASMNLTEGYFPKLALSVVSAGEKGGRLEEAFNRLADHYEKLVKFRNAFLMSIAWPLFELSLAIIIVGALILILGWLVGDEAANWFGMGSALANFMVYAAAIFTILTSLVLLWLGTKKGWFGRLPMQIARRVPIVGKTVEALSLSRLAWAMSIAENAGTDAVEIARMSLEATQNYFYEDLSSEICQSVTAGNDFASSMRKTQAFPEDFLIYVENGEMAGQLAETMDRASAELQTRAETNMKILGTIGFVCTFLFVAAVIGIVVITMMQKFYLDPMNDLMNNF